MTRLSVASTDPTRLAVLLDMSAVDAATWAAEELGSVFRHQLSASIEQDLSDGPMEAVVRANLMTDARGGSLRSFGDVLRHESPPVEVLERIKQFAKVRRTEPEGSLPREVATALYYASLAAALVRCGQRITTLDDEALREGFEWGSTQDWVDDEMRQMFRNAGDAIAGPGAPG